MINHQTISATPSKLVERVALACALGCGLAVLFRWNLGSLTLTQYVLVIGSVSLLLIAWLLAKLPEYQTAAASLILVTIFFTVASYGYSIGGINATITLLLPVAPAAAMIMINMRAALYASFATVGLIAFFMLLEVNNHVFPALDLSHRGLGVMRGYYLLLTTVITSVVVGYYLREQARLTSALAALASKDHLTGLPNRRALSEHLEFELRRARRNGTNLAVIMADLDYFKRYNDTRGHAAGDEALAATARAMESCIARAGDMVGRYGGEEFMVLLPETDEYGAATVAERIRLAVAALKMPYGTPDGATLTMSLGVVSQAITPSTTAAMAAEPADLALYECKNRGRNCVTLTSDMPEKKPSAVEADNDAKTAAKAA